MKTKIFKGILILLLFGQMVNAQGWELTIDVEDSTAIEEAHDIGNDIVIADNGDYLISGRTIEPAGSARFSFVSRISPEGEEVWTNKYLGIVDYLIGIEHAPGEMFYLAGIISEDSPNNDSFVVIKIDIEGDTLWTKKHELPLNAFYSSFTAIENGYVLGGGVNIDAPLIARLDMEANIVSYDTVTIGVGPTRLQNIAESSDQNLLLYGRNGPDVMGGYSFFIQKRSAIGNEIWLYEFDSAWINYFTEAGVKKTSDGGNVFIKGDKIGKLDQNGILEWEKPIPSFFRVYAIEQVNDGGYIITGTVLGGDNKLVLLKTDANGEILWIKLHGEGENFGYIGHNLIEDADGSIIVVGQRGGRLGSGDSLGDVLVVKVNAEGNLYDYFVNGRLYYDENLNCTDDNEQGLDRIFIEITGEDTLYRFPDETGFFEINLDTGNYEIRPILPNPYWGTCIDIPFPFTVTNAPDTQIIDLPLQADIECPYLEVDVSTRLLRRCFDNIYNVNYCNSGTIDAEGPVVTIILDPFLEYQSSSIDLSAQYGDTLEFEIPNVAVGACGSFEILTYLNCDSTVMGQTHCVTALITPDSLCGELDSLWSGASLAVRAECTGDSIYFFIENIGSNDMIAPVNYIVTEDVIMYNEEEVELMVNESVQVLAMEGNGSTWRLEVDQVEGHPGNSNPSIVAEGCVPDGEPFNLYFANIFPEDDGDPFVSIDCQENIGSFDPNDKQGFPKGWDDDHFIERNQDIEYFIRFQNTGTDTAFTVVIKDPISEHLDITSIRPGASSHPYRLGFEGDGVLTFTFDNIMLPDSNINEAASHGFIKFKIAQKEDLDLGTVIYNQAFIFFDFNEAVTTNQTFHTITEPLIAVSIGKPLIPNTEILAYPNPFQESTTIEIKGQDFQNLNLQLFDINGRLVTSMKEVGNQFILKRNGLTSGIYFYRIIGDERFIGLGKVVVR